MFNSFTSVGPDEIFWLKGSSVLPGQWAVDLQGNSAALGQFFYTKNFCRSDPVEFVTTG